jgi:hypothetical protein
MRQYMGVIPIDLNGWLPQNIMPPFVMEAASANPSARETRQAFIEQLWDPNYYKDLYNEPSTIGQKEVYLKAYGVYMINEMVAKQEKIADVYAVETANLLNHWSNVVSSVSSSQPIR